MACPLVSVIVSAYNRPGMLRCALDSLLRQSYRELEILIQDDSTNDECMHVVESYPDHRIRYTRNEPPLGTLRNLRAGYRKSQGKYFCTLNDDDLFSATYIQTMVEAMESNPAYSLSFSDHYIIDEDGQIKQDATEASTAQWGRHQLRQGAISQTFEAGIIAKSIPGMFALFRRDAVDLDDFPDEVSSAYDYWLTYLALRDGRPIYYDPARLTYYRIHSGSQTSSFADPQERLRFLRYKCYIHCRFLADPRLQRIYPTLLSRLAEIYSGMGYCWLRLSDRRRAVQEFVNSCKTKSNKKAIVGLLLCATPMAINRVVLKVKP